MYAFEELLEQETYAQVRAYVEWKE
eukprot:SAG31_NODE_14700_length_792_cov_0.551227_1_plen_24_part_10